MPLVVGTGALRTEDSIEFARMAKGVGADAILVATPPYSVPTGREIALHALAIDRAVDMPVMLYNYPGRMGVNMDEETLDRLGRSPNFCGIKESSGDINRLHLIARDYPHLGLLCGMDDQALEFFAWGRRAGSVPGRISRPRRMWRCTGPAWWRGFHQGPGDHVGDDAADAGAGAGRQVHPVHQAWGDDAGIPAGPPRKPLLPLNKDDKRGLEEVIRTMNTAIAAIEGGKK